MDVPTLHRRDAADHEPFEEHFAWRGGAAAGFVATLVMGLAITVVDPGMLRDPIAGLYGLQGSLLAGWGVHLVHGTIFGLLYALVMADPSLTAGTRGLPRSITAGVVYGVVLAIVGAGVIMPMWLEVVGFAAVPAFPFVTGSSLGWHLIYGAVLGGLFPFLDETDGRSR